MKKALFAMGMALIAATLVGCDDYDKEPLQFINSSSYIITIESLSSEWIGFALAPGQEKKLSGIRDVDYAITPKKYVKKGSASTARYIVFVDIPRDEIQW